MKDGLLFATLSLGLLIGLTYQQAKIAQLEKALHKAQVCNKVFVLYLKHNHGLNINLDRIYEDGVKWVDDPRYQ